MSMATSWGWGGGQGKASRTIDVLLVYLHFWLWFIWQLSTIALAWCVQVVRGVRRNKRGGRRLRFAAGCCLSLWSWYSHSTVTHYFAAGCCVSLWSWYSHSTTTFCSWVRRITVELVAHGTKTIPTTDWLNSKKISYDQKCRLTMDKGYIRVTGDKQYKVSNVAIHAKVITVIIGSGEMTVKK